MQDVEWEIPVCNNCKNSRRRILFRKVTTWEHPGTFCIVECIDCGLVYLSPRPSQYYIGKFYPKETYWGHQPIDENRYKPLYDKILRKIKKGKILDIGAGTGIFLSRFANAGWDIEGVELSKDVVRFAKKSFGIKLEPGDFLDLALPDGYFDIVTFNNSLEHLYKPKETLEKVNKVLKDNGIVIITVPNITSLGVMIFGKHWYPLQPPRHLYHFSEATITDMLRSCSFRIIAVYHNYWVHNFYSLFESFRFFFSPRSVKRESDGLANRNLGKHFSLLKAIGKISGVIFAATIAFIGGLIRRGEVITVYAEKKT